MIFNYIKGSSFFPKYAPKIKDWKKKMSGKNGRGNPLSFNNHENIIIKKGLKKLFKDIL